MGSERIVQWLSQKIDLAERIAAGELGGTYGDGVLILSGVVSGIAAALWPGENIDRKRFVEVWAQFSAQEFGGNNVSLPLLIEALRRQSPELVESVRSLRPKEIAKYPSLDTLVVTGDRVDVHEAEVLGRAELSAAYVRRYSYGSIFYKHVRSGYVHQYKSGTHADEYVMSNTRGDITYSNWATAPRRRINFSMQWLCRIGRSIVLRAANKYWDGEQPLPTRWWIEG